MCRKTGGNRIPDRMRTSKILKMEWHKFEKRWPFSLDNRKIAACHNLELFTFSNSEEGSGSVVHTFKNISLNSYEAMIKNKIPFYTISFSMNYLLINTILK